MNHRSPSYRRLLALVVALPLLVSTLGCAADPTALFALVEAFANLAASFREIGTTKVRAELEAFAPQLTTDNRTAVYPGEVVRTTISPGIRIGALDSMAWTPPSNTGEFTFSKAPENPNGPPPFRWNNLSATDEVVIKYPAPNPNTEMDKNRATELLVVNNGYQERTVTLSYPVRPPSLPQTMRAGDSPAVSSAPLQLVELLATEVVTAWVAILEMSAPLTLTQAYCEALQGEDAYFAMRLPTSPPAAANSASSLPLLHFDNTISNMSIIADTGLGPRTIVTNTLTLRATRINALTNNLPGAEGEVWVALGAASAKPCPEHLATQTWRINLILFLDSASVPAGSYPLYLCLDADPPGPGAEPAQACLGPHNMTLTDWAAPPPFNLSLSRSTVTTPTQTVQFAHQLRKLADGEISFALDNRSTLDGGAWAMFYDKEYNFDPTTPDFTRPITPGQPLDLSLNWLHFWVVKTLPADAMPGQYSVVITATQTAAGGEPWGATVYDTLLVAPDQMTLPDPPPCTPLTGLTLTHRDQRDALGHTFTITGSVTPPTATLPVSYTIQVDGVTQQTTAVGGHALPITMTWTEAGMHTVSIAARACGQPEPLLQVQRVEAMGRLELNTLFLPAIQRLE